VILLSIYDRQGIVILGGIKVNTLENTSSLNIGEITLTGLDSINKSNILAGQVFGDFDYSIFNPIASPLYDPDGVEIVENNAPGAQPSVGLED
jgi:hypothetical protein